MRDVTLTNKKNKKRKLLHSNKMEKRFTADS